MLHLGVSGRADCEEVHKTLAEYYARCLQDANYAVDILPTFQEPASPQHSLPRPPVPDILITSHPSNTEPIASDHAIKTNKVSNAYTTPARNRVSTSSNAPATKHEQLTDHADAAIPHQPRSSAKLKNAETEEKEKISKVEKVLSYLKLRRLTIWHKRRNSPSQSET